MNERSILKQTLLLTAKLVGVFAIWVALITVVAVSAADRMVIALSGAPADKGALAQPPEAAKKDEGASPRVKNLPATVTTKPNG